MMDQSAVLDVMKGYIQTERPDVDVSHLGRIPVPQVLTASIDVIDFVLYLEEKLEVTEEIELDRLGPKFTQNITFAELAAEVVQYLPAR